MAAPETDPSVTTPSGSMVIDRDVAVAVVTFLLLWHFDVGMKGIAAAGAGLLLYYRGDA